MRKIKQSIAIDAAPETVWRAVVSREHYNSWTEVFTSTSHFEGGWNKGDTIKFLAYNKEGKLDGMVSEIAESDFPRFISIRHLGYIYDGQDDTESDEIKSWAPAYENYTFERTVSNSTVFNVENDVTDDYYDMFMRLWPQALNALKHTAESIVGQSIYPCLWFNKEAHAAADFYCNIFARSRKVESNDFVVTFEINGCKFMAINGGPKYKIGQAMSYFVYCGCDEEISRLYSAFMEGGTAIMPLGEYGWSKKYAWVEDKFGVHWQLDIDDIRSYQKVVPTLLFVNEKKLLVKEAIEYYTKAFRNSSVLIQAPYPVDSGMPDGSLLFAQFKLDGVVVNAMSSTLEHHFDFTHGNSLVAECKDQNHIDHLWETLGDGGHYEMCGWLADKYGLSWQVVPAILAKLVSDPIKGHAAIQAMMQMTKFEIEKLTSV